MSFVTENLPVLEEWSRFLSINSDQELDNALMLIESLIDRKHEGETHLSPVIENLGDSIEKYERPKQIMTDIGTQFYPA